MSAFKLRTFDESIIFVRVAEMIALRNNVAHMFIMRFAFAVQILWYLLSRHFTSERSKDPQLKFRESLCWGPSIQLAFRYTSSRHSHYTLLPPLL